MAADTLSIRALNRALLARQMLLCPAPLPEEPPRRARRVIETVEHLGGLQAQAPFAPYYGLWSRLAGFRPDDLATLITGRQVVRIALMRGTIHLVSARDCLAMRSLVQPALDRGFAGNWGKQLPGLDLAALAVTGRELVEDKPMTFSELGAALGQRWPDYPAAALAQAVRTLVPLVQVPPRAVWGRAGQSRHTSAESWLTQGGEEQALSGPPAGAAGPAGVDTGEQAPSGAPAGAAARAADPTGATGPAGTAAPASVDTVDGLVLRYLAAFGPASARDVQTWSGLTRLGEVADRLRPRLRAFRDEGGAELLDLPHAPRPDPQAPAPVRLVAEFDNLLLSHADRSRVIAAGHRQRLYTRNGIFPGTVLIDGFAAGIWRIDRPAGAATLTVEPFGKLSARERDAVAGAGTALLAFAAPQAQGHHDVRFAPAP